MTHWPPQTRKLAISTQGRVHVVTIVDRSLVDPISVREFGDELWSIIEGAPEKNFVLEMSDVRYIVSGALNKLIVFQQRVNSVGGKVALSGLSRGVEEVFSVTRLNLKFNIQPDLPTAIEAIRGETAT